MFAVMKVGATAVLLALLAVMKVGATAGSGIAFLDGTPCDAYTNGNTCQNCLNEHFTWWWSEGRTCCGDEPKWEDGKPCVTGVSCKACENPSSHWYTLDRAACGQEPKLADGTICFVGSSCDRCENGYSYWESREMTFCGSDGTEEVTTNAPTVRPSISSGAPTTPFEWTERGDGWNTPEPTHQPTRTPTGMPSARPISVPTPFPTPMPLPTRAPTDSPTLAPTDTPTLEPTPEPTDSPTFAPTDSPTDAPTPYPTTIATRQPTSAWRDGWRCAYHTSCRLCANGFEYWYYLSSYACGREPCYPAGTWCTIGSSCGKCCNSYYWYSQCA